MNSYYDYPSFINILMQGSLIILKKMNKINSFFSPSEALSWIIT